jgi:GxxExxY protein
VFRRENRGFYYRIIQKETYFLFFTYKKHTMEENYISGQIVDSAILVHKELGPGLLESVYEEALCMELTDRGFYVERQKDLPVFFRGKKLEQGFRTDLIVNNAVIVELKSVEKLTPVFYKVK